MRPTHHVIISAGVTALFSLWIQSKLALTACFLSGILIDVDHHLDYWINKGKFPWRYKDLWNFCANKEQRGRIYLIFHSYEIIILMWALIYVYDLNVVWTGLMLGVTVHIICDEIYNPFRPLAYFFFYRMIHRHDKPSLYKKGYTD